MSDAEIAVVVICLIAGYGLVSAFYKGKEKHAGSQNASDQNQGHGPGANAREEKKEERPRNQERGADESTTGTSDSPQSPKPREWYRVLLVHPSASVEEIKAAYRKRIAEYHPDKVAKLGVELKALAEEKSKEINAAFGQAMKARRY